MTGRAGGSDRAALGAGARNRCRGRGELAMLFEFRGDQLSKVRSYADVEEALRAAGLSE